MSRRSLLRHAEDAERYRARWWSTTADGRVECELCPRRCRLRDGQRGYCFVRLRVGDSLVLDTYGRSSGLCIDPIEKKPLAHFLPGTPVLSFGTAGCNLGCRFCQNWDISTSRETDRLGELAGPEEIAEAAVRTGCRSVAFTYNDPVIFAEFAIDVAGEARERGLKAVAVTAGYIEERARAEFFTSMDAVNVDLKGFDEGFYRRTTGADLPVVLDTLRHIRYETDVWLELTTLLIPGHNDSDEEIRELAGWVRDELGTDIPHHFSAFRPSHRMADTPATAPGTLSRARTIAMEEGLRYVYTGNVHDVDGDTTWCPGCGDPVIVRDWFRLLDYRVMTRGPSRGDLSGGAGRCRGCGTVIVGVFEEKPGGFGPRRIPLQVRPSAG